MILIKNYMKKCYGLDPGTCESDGMCHYIVTDDASITYNTNGEGGGGSQPITPANLTNKCVPKDIFEIDNTVTPNTYTLKTPDNTDPLGITTITGETDKFKCNELDNTISSPLVKTMCPSDFSDTNDTISKNILYETMFTVGTSTPVSPNTNTVGIYDISSFLENVNDSPPGFNFGINFYSGMLDDWNITYILDTNTIDNVEIKEGKISEHTVDGAAQTIMISDLTTEPIHILNIKPPNIHSKTNKYTIKSFIKNPPDGDNMPELGDIINNITDKNTCNINNGQMGII